MIGNLREVGCALRLDHRRDKPDLPVAIEILMEAGLERFQRSAGARHPAQTANIGDVVAVVVGIPRRVLTGARILPGDLIAARRLLRTDRRPGAKLTGHKVRTAKLQRRAAPRPCLSSR